jgi:hypothetical protein
MFSFNAEYMNVRGPREDAPQLEEEIHKLAQPPCMIAQCSVITWVVDAAYFTVSDA